MDHFDKVTATYGDLPYMQHTQAKILRDLIVKNDARDILEIGFFHGKSSAYFAAILEDLNRGHLVTIDLAAARNREPNIDQMLDSLGLAERATPIYAHRSYTWELAKMIRTEPRPAFDFCYFDGGHTWDNTGFGFALVDMLLKPGGWIVFDDIRWTIDAAMENRAGALPRFWQACSQDERETAAVQLVFESMVPHLGYTDQRYLHKGRWGIARKPLDGERGAAKAPIRRPGLVSRLLGR